MVTSGRRASWRLGEAFGLAVWVALLGCAGQNDRPLGPLPAQRLAIDSPANLPNGPSPAPAPRHWKYIVIHHSATDGGNADEFDKMHRARGWDGLGYHFVIDSGQGGPDGRVEVGERWRLQKWGAHTGGTPDNEYNNHGIGICLVGNFMESSPSDAQLASLKALVCDLAARYAIPPGRIIGHRDAPGASTECPGDELESYIRTTLRQAVARGADR
jgi:N-acetyl-anhydromuramyl-L-alanine amidase AmpD